MRVKISQYNNEGILTEVPFWCTPRKVAGTLARLSGVECRIDRGEEGVSEVYRKGADESPIFSVVSGGNNTITVWYNGLSSYASAELVRKLPGEIKSPFAYLGNFLKSWNRYRSIIRE